MIEAHHIIVSMNRMPQGMISCNFVILTEEIMLNTSAGVLQDFLLMA